MKQKPCKRNFNSVSTQEVMLEQKHADNYVWIRQQNH